MTNQKKTQPKSIQRYVHIGLREAYSWEDKDYTREEAGEALQIQVIINQSSEAPQWSGSTCHLYSESIRLPIPSFDPVEKRLAAIDNELADIRNQFYRRKKTLEEQRQAILALTGPSDGYIPRSEMPDDPEAY